MWRLLDLRKAETMSSAIRVAMIALFADLLDEASLFLVPPSLPPRQISIGNRQKTDRESDP
jgi:hypothetical protein